MKEDVSKSVKLQKNDLKLLKLKHKLAEMPTIFAKFLEDIKLAEEHVHNAKKQLLITEQDFKISEQEGNALRKRISDLQVKSNVVKKQDEYDLILHEITKCNEKSDVLDSKGFELLEKIETMKKILNLAENKKKEKDSFAEKKKIELQAEITETRNEIEILKNYHDELAATINQDIIAIYDRMRAFPKRCGVVFAELNNQSLCTFCHMKANPETKISIKSDDKLTYCESCGSLLYLID